MRAAGGVTHSEIAPDLNLAPLLPYPPYLHSIKVAVKGLHKPSQSSATATPGDGACSRDGRTAAAPPSVAGMRSRFTFEDVWAVLTCATFRRALISALSSAGGTADVPEQPASCMPSAAAGAGTVGDARGPAHTNVTLASTTPLPASEADLARHYADALAERQLRATRAPSRDGGPSRVKALAKLSVVQLLSLCMRLDRAAFFGGAPDVRGIEGDEAEAAPLLVRDLLSVGHYRSPHQQLVERFAMRHGAAGDRVAP